jgi:glyoxylase-like metal-dependent hydrolase (beta-lactamase superfamily II)
VYAFKGWFSFLTSGEPFIIDEDVKVVPTPGHTLTDVSVLVNTKDKGLVAVTGMCLGMRKCILYKTVFLVI